MPHCRHLHQLLPLLALWGVFTACHNPSAPAYTPGERHQADSLVKAQRSMEGLDSLYTTYAAKADDLGRMVTLREWGKRLRNESRFDEALRKHSEGLEIAQQTGDTLEWVQALNNLGTDYRRMGILDAAQQYHKSALTMAEECADTSFTAKKNRVISLNGLANVYLTIGNNDMADSTLRQALAGETALHSLTGQAINYANLGSIFESHGQSDSAWAYYRQAMSLNQMDGNALGVALCHTYYGNLYEKDGKKDEALAEYVKAYNLLKTSKDEWHMLNPLIALAGAYLAKGNTTAAERYLAEALQVATKIGSIEHKAEVYNLYYRLRKQRGDWRDALAAHERASALQDSLIDVEKVNRMQSVSYNIERGQQQRRMTKAQDELSRERVARYIGYAVFAVIFLLLAAIIALLIHTRRLRARSHEALKKLNTAREAFFTNITHEFRTPLTVILGLSRDLQSKHFEADELRKTAHTIERQGDRMLLLINQLLDLSKIRSAIGEPDWRRGNIVAYVGMIVETFEDYAASRSIRLQFAPQEDVVETTFVPEYINKVMSNLISNALKFTAQGGKVKVATRHDDGRFRIRVSDTGRGIPAENLPHIFEPFYQGGNTDGVGTGVGLALVSQIVQLLGGTISVESSEGAGTTFHIALPIRHAKAPSPDRIAPQLLSPQTDEAPTPADEEPAEGQEHTQRVLVVEDNADVAQYIGQQLADRYAVFYATNGLQGLTSAKEEIPDAIVADVMMPKMDGLELCRRIRAEELTSHIPVILVTAKVTEADRLRGLEAGADAYMVKPFSSQELLMRLEKLLAQRKLLREKFTKDLTVHSQVVQSDTSGVKPNTAESHFVTRLTDAIFSLLNAGKTADVNAVADRMNMSYSQLYRKLSAVTELTPVQFIQRVKVAKARQLLTAHPDMALNIVAERSGFLDYSNFVRAFRNVLDLTPTQFVRQIHAKAEPRKNSKPKS